MIRLKIFAPPLEGGDILDSDGFLSLPDDAILEDLIVKFNIPSNIRDAIAVSVNRVLVDPDTPLKDGDEVAIIMSLPAG